MLDQPADQVEGGTQILGKTHEDQREVDHAVGVEEHGQGGHNTAADQQENFAAAQTGHLAVSEDGQKCDG